MDYDRGKVSANAMPKILIADDHPLFRKALRQVLEHLLPQSELACFEAANRSQVFDQLEREEWDLILLDLCMPGMNGLPELIALRAAAPATPVVIVSSLEDTAIIRQAINCGVAGYVPKSSPPEVLSAAMKTVLEGGVYIPCEMASGGAPLPGGKTAKDFDPLTPRQLAVLSLLAAGKSNKQIARELSISDLTVKVHMTTIFRKLGVATRTQAIVAFQHEKQNFPDHSG
jgi:DNA-binding NarL/FixJ family response regulator